MIQSAMTDGVLVLRLNAPPLNPITRQTLAELRGAIDLANRDASAKGIVITGSADHFSAGADVQLFRQITGADDASVREQVEVQAKYRGYIERQAEEIAQRRRHDGTALPDDLDYSQVKGLSAEVTEKLTAARPHSIGQAARLPGITPAAVSLLLVHLKKRRSTAA